MSAIPAYTRYNPKQRNPTKQKGIMRARWLLFVRFCMAFSDSSRTGRRVDLHKARG
jgi:hypothetical protein